MARTAPGERRQLPPPLPPATRTVGQLVAEAIRLYGRRFWRSLALGLGPAGLSVGETFLRGWQQFTLGAAGGVALFSLCFVGGCAIAAERRAGWRELARACLIAVLIWIPVPFLVLLLFPLFVLPAVAWLALVGLAVPAAVLEGLTVRRAIGRGLALGRVDYVHALGSLAALAIVVGGTSLLLSLLIRTGSQQETRVALFLGTLVVYPLLFLGGALLYYDQAARLQARK